MDQITTPYPISRIIHLYRIQATGKAGINRTKTILLIISLRGRAQVTSDRGRPKNKPKYINTLTGLFKLLFTDELIKVIVIYSNKKLNKNSCISKNCKV